MDFAARVLAGIGILLALLVGFTAAIVDSGHDSQIDDLQDEVYDLRAAASTTTTVDTSGDLSGITCVPQLDGSTLCTPVTKP